MDCWLIGTLALAAISLLFPLWIRTITRRMARNILNQMRAIYGQPHVNRPADARTFPDADQAFYAASQTCLEQAGFRVLADIENVTVNDLARRGPKGGVALPTFQRVLLGDDATTVAVVYHTRVQTPTGNGRTLAPKDVRVVEFGSHFDDGTALDTQPWTTAVHLDPVPGDRRAVLPADATIEQLLAAHRAGVAQVLSTWKNTRLIPTRTVDEFVALLNRIQEKRRAHRHSIGWITEAELVRMSGEGKQAIAKSIYREIQHILKKEAAVAQV
jgi:hypothetical protein